MRVALVVVSHSARLADGVVEVAAQMAPDVELRAAGGTADGGIGTSFDRVADAVARLRDAGHPVVVLTDLGSATMTAAAVLEFLDDGPPARVADAPLVEGAVAAAVAAQIGRPLDEVVAAAEGAGHASGADASAAAEAGAADAGTVRRSVVLVNDVGLHARPAALLAQVAASFDAEVSANGVDATSMTDLILLDLGRGAVLDLAATGPQAAEAVDAVAALVEAGFRPTLGP